MSVILFSRVSRETLTDTVIKVKSVGPSAVCKVDAYTALKREIHSFLQTGHMTWAVHSSPPCDLLQYLLIWMSSKGTLKGMVVLAALHLNCVCVYVCVGGIILVLKANYLSSSFPDPYITPPCSMLDGMWHIHWQVCVVTSCIHFQKCNIVKPTSCFFFSLVSWLPYILIRNTQGQWEFLVWFYESWSGALIELKAVPRPAH